jgi:hypothetical protein
MLWKVVAAFGKMHRLFENKGPGPAPLSPAEAERRKGLAAGHVLMSFQVSPYSQKVRRAIRELQIPIPIRDVLEDDTAWNELMAGGKIDMVPCMRIEEGGKVRWMYESADIIAYLQKRVSA